MTADIRTLPAVNDARRARRTRMWRRVGLSLLAALVVAAAVGVLGPYSRVHTVTADSGQTVEIEYPAVTRPGLDIAFTITIDAPERALIEVAVSRALVDTLGINRIDPEPRTQAADGDLIVLTFHAPHEGPAQVAFTGHVPSRQDAGVRDFDVEVRGPSGAGPMSFRTWVLP